MDNMQSNGNHGRAVQPITQLCPQCEQPMRISGATITRDKQEITFVCWTCNQQATQSSMTTLQG